jgi:hypothetical protein
MDKPRYPHVTRTRWIEQTKPHSRFPQLTKASSHPTRRVDRLYTRPVTLAEKEG